MVHRPARRSGGGGRCQLARRAPGVERPHVVGPVEGRGVGHGASGWRCRAAGSTDSYSWSAIQDRSSASTVRTCSGPSRRSAEVIIATSAPTIRALSASVPEWIPEVAASPTRRPELGPQDGDPAQRQAQLPGAAELDAVDHLERLEVEVGLVEAVEQDEPVGALGDDAGGEVGHRGVVRAELDGEGDGHRGPDGGDEGRGRPPPCRWPCGGDPRPGGRGSAPARRRRRRRSAWRSRPSHPPTWR